MRPGNIASSIMHDEELEPSAGDDTGMILRRRKALGAFLRQRRSQTRPEEIGLSSAGRRHVRGLRRDEVALAADIGLSWYTMLEQGRVENVSGRTITAVAEVLRLPPRERAHLRSLAAASFDELNRDLSVPPAELVDFVQTFSRGGAWLHSPLCELVAWNGFADQLLNLSKQPRPPNLLRVMLEEPAARSAFRNPDWAGVFSRMVGYLRMLSGEVGGADFEALVNELSDWPEFRLAWNQRSIVPPPSERCILEHPVAGLADVDVIAFNSPSAPTYLVVLMIARQRPGAEVPADRRPVSLPPRSLSAELRRKRRVEMGAFLRRRRAEIQPAERGVTADGSRRVSGLRREEIARLSGLGLSWYTMLEQGRVENLTPRTLAAIADALGLTPLERRYLRTLADESFAELTESGSPPSEELLEFVRSYQAGHAHLESARLDVLAWNDEADELFAFSRRGGTPNLLTIMAHDEAVRRRFIDPSADTVLAEMLAHARLNLAQYGGVEFSDLIEQIAGESTAFAERWARDLRVMQPRVERGRSYIGKNGARETIFIALKPSANPQYTMILIHPVDAR